jgi:hypothetical protein
VNRTSNDDNGDMFANDAGFLYGKSLKVDDTDVPGYIGSEYNQTVRKLNRSISRFYVLNNTFSLDKQAVLW